MEDNIRFAFAVSTNGKFMDEHFGEAEFSDTSIPLKIITCDLCSGEEIVIEEGSIVDALVASISVPGIF